MNPEKNRFDHFCVALNTVLVTVAELALVLLMIVTVYAVFARYVLRSPSMYAMEVSTYLLLVVAWGSVGWAHYVNRHVSMEAFTVTLNRKWRRCADIVSQITILVFCSVLLWSGSKVVITAIARNYRSASLLKFPLWVAYLAIPVGAVTLGLIALLRLRRAHPALHNREEAR